MPAELKPPAVSAHSRPHLWAVALALVTLALFAPVRNFEFVNFDDNVFVFTNDFVKQGFTWGGIRWAFLSADIDYWRPLSWLSHMMDVELFGLRAGGHHMTSVVIHAVNAVMLLFALDRLTRRFMPSLLVAALFAWHPLHVESVAWIAERKDVLCAFFWFLGLWCYAGHAESPGRKRFAAVAACLALGLMSKPMILTFPFLLLLLDVWPLRRAEFTGDWREFARRFRPLVLEKLPLFAMIVAAAAATFIAQRNVGAMMPDSVHPLSARLMNAPVSYARYLGLTFWPTDLAIMYPMPQDWPAWQLGGALTLLGVVTWFCVRRLAGEPWLAVGWFWFLGTLVPVLGLIQVGDQSIANRYTYVPLVGFFIAVAWSLDSLRTRHPAASSWLVGATVMVLALCAADTRAQLWHWRNGITIFERALQATENNFVAMTNLGNNLARRGQQQRAMDLYQQALRVRPDSSDTHYNLATSLAETGQPQAAERHYREALRWQPGHSKSHNNLANLLADTGRVPEAIQHYEECLRLKPGNTEARFNYGITLADMGRPADAIAQFEAAVKREPAFTRARLQLVSLLAALGKSSEAMAHNTELLRHEAASPEGHFNAGSFASAHGDWGTAVQHWQEAVRLRPEFTAAVHRLAWTLATHPSAAVRNPKSALDLAAHFARLDGAQKFEALDLLAVAHAANSAFEPAVRHAQQALAAAGTNAAMAAEIRARLALFQGGRPFIEGAAK
ncbi:MAG: tetratricopeptide repeat protein [Verrucomicrobia bacterium]|nr:tetratricopeptide repeat protein [Verrucomicrobiota bacterium]